MKCFSDSILVFSTSVVVAFVSSNQWSLQIFFKHLKSVSLLWWRLEKDFTSLEKYFWSQKRAFSHGHALKPVLSLVSLRFLVNIEGCVNLENCSIDFFDEIQKHRDLYENYTVPCYYDEFTQVALFNHEPDAQKATLYIAAFLPSSLLVLSCLLMSIITALVQVSNFLNSNLWLQLLAFSRLIPMGTLWKRKSNWSNPRTLGISFEQANLYIISLHKNFTINVCLRV